MAGTTSRRLRKRGPRTAPAAQGPTKLCVVCATEIPAAAKKCTNCDSYQDWTRFLTFSSTVLGLLVALVSILTFALPIWKRVWFPPEPRPMGAVINHTNLDSIIIAFSNGGDAPYTLSTVSEVTAASRLEVHADLFTDYNKVSPVVYPNRTVVLKFCADNVTVDKAKDQVKPFGKITFIYSDTLGHTKPKDIPLDPSLIDYAQELLVYAPLRRLDQDNLQFQSTPTESCATDPRHFDKRIKALPSPSGSTVTPKPGL